MSEQLNQDTLVAKVTATEVKVDNLKEAVNEVKDLLKEVTRRQALLEEANRQAIEKAREDYRSDRKDDIVHMQRLVEQVSSRYEWTDKWKNYIVAGAAIVAFLYYFIKPWYEGYVKVLMQP